MASLQIGVFLFALSCTVLHVKAFQISNMDNVHISDHELALQKHQADVEKLMRMNQLHQQQQQYQPQHQHTQQQQIYQRALTQNSTFNQIYQIDTKALAKPEKGCVDEVKKVTETVHDDVILCNLSYETQCSMIDTTKFEAVSSEECTNESTACNINYSQDPPQEECVLTEKVCTTTTKMVPRTEQAEDCVDVPKEVCTRSNANPQEITKKVVKRTCYNPVDVAPTTTTTTTTTTTCYSGWQEYEGACYIYQAVRRTWEEASNACQQLHLGAQLTSVTNAGENEFLRVLAGGYWSWNGGRHRQPETPSGSWTWSDGALWSFTNWSPGRPDSYPNGHCVIMGSSSGQLYNAPCSNNLGSLCKYSL